VGLSDAPRSIRTNNPGALNYGPFAQRYGAVGSDGRLAIFPDVETGRRAMAGLLDTYERKHGLNSVAGIINRWAPPNVDNNSTGLYIKTVASKLGVDPNAPLTAQHRPALMDAMAAYEAGTSNIPRQGSFASPGGGLSGASPPMALSNAYVNPQEQPGYLDRVLNSPLFMMGASVLGAPNIGTGLMQGSQAASQGAMARERLANERAMMPMRQMLMQSQVEQAASQGAMARERLANESAMMPMRQMLMQSQVDQAQQERQMAPLKMQLMEAQVKKAMEPATTDDIREFQYAKNNGFPGGFQDWMKQKRDMNGQTAQQITWGTDDKGNYVPMQASRDGKLVASQMPPNVTPVPAEVLAFRKAAATEQGQGAGKAKVDLPAVRTNANMMLDAIDAIEKDDNLPAMTEGLSAWLPNITEKSRASAARIDQVQGKAFLQAYAGLRGGGAITEAEGAKATASLSRLQELRVGTAEYKQALDDRRWEVQALVALAEQKAAAGEPNMPVRPQGGAGGAAVPAGSYVFDPATGQLRPR